MSQTDASSPAYQDKDRPNGVARADAPAPGWFQESMNRSTKTIVESLMRVIHHDQHEYLENRRLPHTIKTSEALVKPHLLPTGEVILTTVFPVATDKCFVAYFTPVFDNAFNPMSGAPTPSEEEAKVTSYDIFTYREGRLAVENTPQNLIPLLIEELRRQAHAMKLRQVQFLYFSILSPQHTGGYEDPHGYLAKLTASSNHYVQKAVGEDKGPTPLDD